MNWQCSTHTPASCTAPLILLVTNDKSAHDLVCQALGDGYACLWADGRQAAEDALRKQPIGLILLDHAEDHPRFLRYLRETYPKIPVIYMAEEPAYELVRYVLSYEGGAKCFLRKPDELARLVRHVSCFLKNGDTSQPNKVQCSRNNTKTFSVVKNKMLHREKRLREIEEAIRLKPRQYTSGILARKFDVTPRQIRRDIQILIDRGCPIRKEKNQYCIDEK